MALLKFGTKFITFGNSILRFVKPSKPVIPTDYVLYKASDIVGSYNSSSGPAFYFKPAESFETDFITVYAGRSYTASTSNPNGDIAMCFIEEYDSSKTHTKTLMSYQTASIYGATSSTGTPQWFSDINGGGRSDTGSRASSSTGVGLHSIYSVNSIEVDGVTLYQYRIKLANGNRLLFNKDCIYRLGFAAGFHCSSANQLYTLGINYPADKNNCLVTHPNNATSISTTYINDCYLPYFKIGTVDADGNIESESVFTDFDLYDEPAPISKVEFTNGTFSTTSYTDFTEFTNSIQTGDKLAILVRHAERGDVTGKNGGLTSNGVVQAKQIGIALHSFYDTEDEVYIESTDVLRTAESVYWMAWEHAAAKGSSTAYTQPTYNSTTNEIETNIPKSSIYSGSAYTTINDWDTLSNWCKTDANKQTIIDVSQIILRHIVDTSTKKFNMYCSHDSVLVPMISYVTNWKLVPTSSSWCNYLNGIAVILRANGTIEIAPVNALI